MIGIKPECCDLTENLLLIKSLEITLPKYTREFISKSYIAVNRDIRLVGIFTLFDNFLPRTQTKHLSVHSSERFLVCVLIYYLIRDCVNELS
jgi:hypothetical protein